MDDLSKAELKENYTESFHTTARTHLKDAFGRLNSDINQALGVDQFPIK
jgi:hypothetical protein